jgi:predicted CopG family antitoxin
MKTITLTDQAYLRLKEWKQGRGDSFSDVVLKMVPERGTLEQMLDDVAHLPALSKENAKVMEEAAGWGREPTGHREPWTS